MKNPLHELQSRLKGRDLREVARRSGSSVSRIYERANNPDAGMTITTLMALHKAMDEMDAEKEEEK